MEHPDTEWEYLDEEKVKFWALKVEFVKWVQQGVKLAASGR